MTQDILERPLVPADAPDRLRTATQEDFLELLRISKMLHEENGQHPLSERKLWELLTRGICRDGAIIGVIGDPGDIKAMIFLGVESCYYSDDLIIVERWAFTRPDCRKTDFAKRLIRFAKHCADQTGLELNIGIISDERLAAKERLYARELPKGGSFFVYRPEK